MEDEVFALQLLEMAERWAEAVGATLRNREAYSPTVFSVSRRPEARALLAAAVELYDLVGASPAGSKVMRAAKLDPDAGALMEWPELEKRWQEWLSGRMFVPNEQGSEVSAAPGGAQP